MAESTPTKRPHFGRHAGIRFQSAAAGHSRFTCELQDFHLNPNGIVHGGVTYTLVDQAMGSALYGTLAVDEAASTLEIKINYLRAARMGELVCEGWVVEREGRIATLEAEVKNGDVLIAKALGTYIVTPRRKSGYRVEQSIVDAQSTEGAQSVANATNRDETKNRPSMSSSAPASGPTHVPLPEDSP